MDVKRKRRQETRDLIMLWVNGVLFGFTGCLLLVHLGWVSQ